MKKYLLIFTILYSSSVFAEGWCTLKSGFSVTTHGRKSEDVWVNGTFEGEASNHWVQIASTDRGAASVSIALAALMSGRELSVYIDAADQTCANIPGWYDGVRHVRVK